MQQLTFGGKKKEFKKENQSAIFLWKVKKG